ncbi:MAG: hypothetical protein HRF46_05680, partial [Acidobacteriota bacterium]
MNGAAWAFFRAWWRDAVRRGWLRADARTPAMLRLRWELLAVAVSGLAAALWLASAAGSMAAAAGGWVLSPGAVGALLGGVGGWTAALLALAVVLSWEAGEATDLPLPLPRHAVLLPPMVAGVVEAGAWTAVVTVPLAAFLGPLAGYFGAAGAWLCVSAAAAGLGLAGVATAVWAGWLRVAAPRTREAALAGLGVLAAVMFAALAWMAPAMTAGGPRGTLDRWEMLLGHLGWEAPAWAVARAAGGPGALAAVTLAVVAVACGGWLASVWLARVSEVVAASPRRPGLAGGSPGQALARRAEAVKWPLLRLEAVMAMRDPGRLVRDLAGTALSLVVLVAVFPAKSAAVAVTVAFFVPVGVCGAVALHAVGRDGTLVELVVLAGRVRQYLLTKLLVAAGLAGVASLVAGAGLWAGRRALGLEPAQLGAALFLLPVAAVASAVWAMGLGSLWADRRVRRLLPGQGVG